MNVQTDTQSLAVERAISGLRARVRAWRNAGESVGLVPTMGALHDGHMALVRAARAGCDRVVVSIFVNPAQFGEGEDFDEYPRQEKADLDLLAGAGVDIAFIPSGAEVYPKGFATSVSVSGLSEGLCGAARPGFFSGVATVVTKLFLQCMPDAAWFGEKDYQQLQVIRRMARDLDIPVEIHAVETVREADGLAISSRNAYLSADERRRAPALHRALQAVAGRVAAGDPVTAALAEGRRIMEEAGISGIEYFEVRDAETLEPADDRPPREQRLRVFAAARLGDTRLIDNLPVD